MLRVTVTVADPSDRIAKVSGADGDVTLGLSQARTFSVPDGGSLTIAEGEIVDNTIRDASGEVQTDISEGNHGNPNGIMSAEIAPKMPKPGGETVIERQNGMYVETTPSVDQAAMRRGGGPDSTDGVTPGPKPQDAPGGTIRDPASEQGTPVKASPAGTQVAGAPKPVQNSKRT